MILMILVSAAGDAAEVGGLRLEYEGAFAPPSLPGPGVRYGYGMKGMAYSLDCSGRPDPSPDDGYPGCLLATSHPEFDMVGMFDIPTPAKVPDEDRTNAYWGHQLGQARPVVDFFDPSGGIKKKLEGEREWKARDIPGVLLVGDDLISTCGHDWYNAARLDHDSHCWAKFDPGQPAADAIGAYNFGPARDPAGVFHADKMSTYIGVVGQRFADRYLEARGEPRCFSGMQRRAAGTPGRSQGPTLYAHSCDRPAVEPPGFLDATPILAYRPRHPISVHDSDFPEFSPTNHCTDAEWIELGELGGVLVACRQGGPYWWYGSSDPWREPPTGPLINHRNLCFWNRGDPQTADGRSCKSDFLAHGPPIPCYERNDETGRCTRGLVDRCFSAKGYHAVFEQDPQHRARLLWYPEQGLADILQNKIKPWEAPFEIVLDHPAELWPACAAAFGGTALDPKLAKLYVAQIDRGEFPVVHVYKLARASD